MGCGSSKNVQVVGADHQLPINEPQRVGVETVRGGGVSSLAKEPSLVSKLAHHNQAHSTPSSSMTSFALLTENMDRSVPDPDARCGVGISRGFSTRTAVKEAVSSAAADCGVPDPVTSGARASNYSSNQSANDQGAASSSSSRVSNSQLILVVHYSSWKHKPTAIKEVLDDICRDCPSSSASSVSYVATPTDNVITRDRSMKDGGRGQFVSVTLISDPGARMRSSCVEIPKSCQDKLKLAREEYAELRAATEASLFHALADDEETCFRSPSFVLLSSTTGIPCSKEASPDEARQASMKTTTAINGILRSARGVLTRDIPTFGTMTHSNGGVVTHDLPGVATAGIVVLTIVHVTCRVFFDNVSGYSPTPCTGVISAVNDENPFVIERINDKLAADVISAWIFGKHDMPKGSLLGKSLKIPLGVEVRVDDEGALVSTLHMVTDVDEETRSVTMSGVIPAGAEVVVHIASPSGCLHTVSRALDKTLSRENFIDLRVVGALSFMSTPCHLDFVPERQPTDVTREYKLNKKKNKKNKKVRDLGDHGKELSMSKLFAAWQNHTAEIRAKTEKVLGNAPFATVFSSANVGCPAIGYASELSPLNTGRLLFAIPTAGSLAGGEESTSVHPGFGTVVFTDIKRSGDIMDWNPAAMTMAMALHDDILRQVAYDCAGVILRTEGDAFMIYFRTSMDALRFTLLAQERLLEAPWEDELLQHTDCEEVKASDGQLLFRGLRVRMGIHLLREEVDYAISSESRRVRVYGGSITRGAQICSAGDGGQIMMTSDLLTSFMRPELTRQVQNFYAGDAGKLKIDKHELSLFYVTPIQFKSRSFDPLRKTRIDKGHWTQTPVSTRLWREATLLCTSSPSVSSGGSLATGSILSNQRSRILGASGLFSPSTQNSVSAHTSLASGSRDVSAKEGQPFTMQSATSNLGDTSAAIRSIIHQIATAVKPPTKHMKEPLPSALVIYATEDHEWEQIAYEMTKKWPGIPAIGGTIASPTISEAGWTATASASSSMGILAIFDRYGVYKTASASMGEQLINALEAGVEIGKKTGEFVLEAMAKREEMTIPENLTVNAKPAVWLMQPFGREEDTLDGLEEGLGDGYNVTIGGGSTGARNGDHHGFQYHNGTIEEYSAVALFMLPSTEVYTHFNHGYTPSVYTGVLTQVEGRVIHEIDGRRAAMVYSEWSGGAYDVEARQGGHIMDSSGKCVLGYEVDENQFGESVYSIIHVVSITPSGGLVVLSEPPEGVTVRVLVGTEFSRRRKTCQMIRSSMRKLRDAVVHGTLFAYCMSQAQCAKPARLGSGIAASFRYLPSLGGGTSGQVGQYSHGRVALGTSFVSSLIFATPSEFVVEPKNGTEVAPSKPIITIAIASIDNFEDLAKQSSRAADEVVGEFFRHCRLVLRESDDPPTGYACTTDIKSFTCAFNEPVDAVTWGSKLQLALMHAVWPAGCDMSRKNLDGSIIFNGPSVSVSIAQGRATKRFNVIANRYAYTGPAVNIATNIDSGPRKSCKRKGLISYPANMITKDEARALNLITETRQASFKTRELQSRVQLVVAAPEQLKSRLEYTLS